MTDNKKNERKLMEGLSFFSDMSIDELVYKDRLQKNLLISLQELKAESTNKTYFILNSLSLLDSEEYNANLEAEDLDLLIEFYNA